MLKIEERDKMLIEVLALHSYEYWDLFSDFDRPGLTHVLIKEQDGVRLSFSFWWDNQGGSDFWEGLLRASFNYEPRVKGISPIMFVEIVGIQENTLKFLPIFEKNIIVAIKTQKEIENYD